VDEWIRLRAQTKTTLRCLDEEALLLMKQCVFYRDWKAMDRLYKAGARATRKEDVLILQVAEKILRHFEYRFKFKSEDLKVFKKHFPNIEFNENTNNEIRIVEFKSEDAKIFKKRFPGIEFNENTKYVTLNNIRDAMIELICSSYFK
jgi:hypothetical protein